MHTAHTVYSAPRMLFELRDLEALPCGCVAADYVARLLSLDVVAVEAKGPHCTVRGHANGALLAPGELACRSAAKAPPVFLDTD